jgi:hypothetical protein
VMRNVGDEKLLMPSGAQVANLNGLIILNDTAAYLWELLATECSIDELITAVEERFEVAAEVACDDVRAFVEEITRIGILEP